MLKKTVIVGKTVTNSAQLKIVCGEEIKVCFTFRPKNRKRSSGSKVRIIYLRNWALTAMKNVNLKSSYIRNTNLSCQPPTKAGRCAKGHERVIKVASAAVINP